MRFAYPSVGEQNAAILFIQSLIKQILTFEMLPVRRRLKSRPKERATRPMAFSAIGRVNKTCTLK